jgi:hypothetical protein
MGESLVLMTESRTRDASMKAMSDAFPSRRPSPLDRFLVDFMACLSLSLCGCLLPAIFVYQEWFSRGAWSFIPAVVAEQN